MQVTYKDGRVPKPANQFSTAPDFGSGNTVLVDGKEGMILRAARDKTWLDIRFPLYIQRFYWNQEHNQYSSVKQG